MKIDWRINLSPFLFSLIGVGVVSALSATVFADQPGNTRLQIQQGDYQYKLIMSKDDKVCGRMLGVYNLKLKKHGYEMYDGSEDEFKAINWRDVKTFRLEAGKKIYSVRKGTKLDINNDGRDEFVIKETTLFGGYDADLLFIFTDKQSNHAKEFSVDELRESPGKIYMAGWWYDLQPPLDFDQKTLPGIRVIQPFIFQNVAYISMHPFFDLGFGGMRKILVIAKYRKGRLVPREDQTGAMEDICYLEKVQEIK